MLVFVCGAKPDPGDENRPIFKIPDHPEEA
jgi:hypothetical protein